MNDMTLPSGHRIWNSRPGCPSTSTLPLCQGGSPQYWIFTIERGRNILFLWNLNGRAGDEARHLSKQAALTTAPGHPRLLTSSLKCKVEFEWHKIWNPMYVTPTFYVVTSLTSALSNTINPFVTSPGDLRDLGRPFRYEPRRSPGLIAWDNYDVIK